jgi:hypothetical protein
MPYVVAIHQINDPESFWSGAARAIPNLPPEVTLHASYPQGDGSRAVCLWEAESVDAVRELVDSGTADTSRNEYFEVDAQHAGARGLPARAASA